MAVGVTEGELSATVVGPDRDSLTAQAVLKDLAQKCLFLHYDGAHYAFRTTPNVTQVLEDQAAYVRPPKIEAAIEEKLRGRLAGSIRVSVEATHAEGFEAGWLRNAVEELLDEADVEWEGGTAEGAEPE